MANDFSGDSNCVALWRFESGALTTDSKGTNTLTDENTVGTETSDYKEGSACADLERDASEHFQISDANLDSSFPLKTGGSGVVSVVFWVKFESVSAFQWLFTKWDSPTNVRSFGLALGADNKIGFYIGHTSGTVTETVYISATTLTSGKWYHIAATYSTTTKGWQLVVWDDTSSSKVINTSSTATNNISLTTAELCIGNALQGTASINMDGLFDEVVVFKDILTTGEIDQIRAGTYGAGGGDTKKKYRRAVIRR